jgi:phosphate transport system substrate-binding protein
MTAIRCLLVLGGTVALSTAMSQGGPLQAATHRSQTDAERAITLVKGRKEPVPEVLQPRVEDSIATYQPRRDVVLSGHFHGAISDTTPRLVHSWVAEFENIYPDVRIDVPPPYSGTPGTKGITEGTLDFAIITRELEPALLRAFITKHGYAPLSVPISGGSYRQFGFLDAATVIVNTANPVKGLTYQQLDRIFSSTHLRGGTPATKWGDVGATGAWANKPIHVYGITPWDGIEEFFRQKVLNYGGQRGEWTKSGSFSEDGIGVADKVSADPYGITYESVGLVNPTGNRMMPLAENAGGEFVDPSYENVTTTRYPLARQVYINFNKQPGKPLDPALVEFVKFIISKQGQQAIVTHGIFLPLRQYQIDESLRLIGQQ